jgi:hypothetical protein
MRVHAALTQAFVCVAARKVPAGQVVVVVVTVFDADSADVTDRLHQRTIFQISMRFFFVR